MSQAAVSVRCPGKTNLELKVGPRRSDWGDRHLLDTTYCAVGIYDTVTVALKSPGRGFSLDIRGDHLGDLGQGQADMGSNLAVQALFALAQAGGREPDASIRIDKRIPVGAGLAGGSADAAGVLLALNILWRLDWPHERLEEVAAVLGADVPFCLRGGILRGRDYGQTLEPATPGPHLLGPSMAAGGSGHLLVGAYLDELGTADVYTAFDTMGGDPEDDNDLQRAACNLHPRSRQAIELALRAGAERAFVSGSGPSVVALLPDLATARRIRDTWAESCVVDRIIAADAPAWPELSYTVSSDPVEGGQNHAGRREEPMRVPGPGGPALGTGRTPSVAPLVNPIA